MHASDNIDGFNVIVTNRATMPHFKSVCKSTQKTLTGPFGCLILLAVMSLFISVIVCLSVPSLYSFGDVKVTQSFFNNEQTNK